MHPEQSPIVSCCTRHTAYLVATQFDSCMYMVKFLKSIFLKKYIYIYISGIYMVYSFWKLNN